MVNNLSNNIKYYVFKETYVTYHSKDWEILVLQGFCTWEVDDNNVALMKLTVW